MSNSLSTQGSSFVQNGTIDWPTLVKNMVNASIRVMSRVSAAGVDTYTVIIAQALGKQFQLTKTGRQRVTQAVTELSGIQTIHNKLWLGFGINNFVRIITRTEEGTMCLAMCTALTECYNDQVAAEIMMEMVRTSNAPSELQPSVFEWKALLHATSGIYARTKFSTLAEDLMSRHRTQRGLPHEYSANFGNTQRTCSSPESIAQALLLIGQISRGQLEKATLSGGSDAGWLAAFAVWHFNLAVRVVWEDNAILYESDECVDGNFQLLVIYTSGKGPQIIVDEKTHLLQDATGLICWR